MANKNYIMQSLHWVPFFYVELYILFYFFNFFADKK